MYKSYNTNTHIAIEKKSAAIMARAAQGQQTSLRAHLTRVAGYLGIGALVHAWFLGPNFDSSSLWSWGYVATWPIPLGLWFLAQVAVFGLYALLLIVACALLFAVAALAHDAHQKRKANRERVRAADLAAGRGRFDPR